MTDTAELIARLNKLDRDGPDSLFPAAAAALAAQAEEIKQLHADYQRICRGHDQLHDERDEARERAEVQAQEIERLTEKIFQYEINSVEQIHIIAVKRAEMAEARVRELERMITKRKESVS